MHHNIRDKPIGVKPRTHFGDNIIEECIFDARCLFSNRLRCSSLPPGPCSIARFGQSVVIDHRRGQAKSVLLQVSHYVPFYTSPWSNTATTNSQPRITQ